MAHIDGDVLDEGIIISDLLSGGVVFSFESSIDRLKEFEFYENEFFEERSTQILEEGGDLEHGAPGQCSFKQLSEKMENILIGEDGIKKMLLKSGYGKNIEDGALVEVHYNAFWEGENMSFDSSYLRGEPKKFIVGEGIVIPGLEEAVKSMTQGEQARFLISYKLLFGERGCPPRVKPKADGLFNIEVLRVIDSYKVTEIDKQNEQSEEPIFARVYRCAKSLHVNGLDAFKHNNLPTAVKYFHRAVNILETSRLSCVEEQNDQQKMLLKLYTNLAVCYNKQNNPRRACSMCNEIKRITNINVNCKALYQFGIALQSLGEYDKANIMLSKAFKLKPDNIDVGRRLTQLETLIHNQNKIERDMCEKIFNMSLPVKEEEEVLDNSKDYKNEILNVLTEFNKSKMRELKFPSMLNSNEIKFVKEVIHNKQYNMTMQRNADSYCIKKKYI